MKIVYIPHTLTKTIFVKCNDTTAVWHGYLYTCRSLSDRAGAVLDTARPLVANFTT